MAFSPSDTHMFRRVFLAVSCFALSACGVVPFGFTSEEEGLLLEARGAIRKKMSAPGSAKFRKNEAVNVHPKKGLVCGDQMSVGKSAGAEAGFQPYYYRRGSGAYLASDPKAAPIIQSCTDALKRITDKFSGDEADAKPSPS